MNVNKFLNQLNDEDKSNLKNLLKIIVLSLITLAVCICGVIALITPKQHMIDVKFTEWTYTIQIQELTPIKHSGRSRPPEEAYNITVTKRYETVHDGYDSQGKEITHKEPYSWYEYTVDEWKNSRTIVTHGTDKDPYWGEVILKGTTDPRGIGNERTAGRTELYTITGSEGDKLYSLNVSKELWEQAIPGQDYVNFLQRKIGDPYSIEIAK